MKRLVGLGFAAFAVSAVLATERPADMPEPVYEAEPAFVDFYYKAWELAKGRIHETKGLPAERYMDEGLWETDIWIWDTCFMSFFCKYAPKSYPGIESLDNFYSLILQDGKFKPVMVKADNPYAGVKVGELTPLAVCIADNPPLFAWAELVYAKQTGDRARLERVLKKEGLLQRCYDFIETVTPAWKGAGVHASICAEKTPDGYRWEGGRSGMDNTPRGRKGPSATATRPADRDLLWLDLLAQQALAADSIAQAYEIFYDKNGALRWRTKRDEKNALLNRLYWQEKDGFYYDIFASTREPCKVTTVASYWAMMCGAASRNQAARMCEKIEAGGELAVAGGVASLSTKDADFDPSGKYWRGSVWLPTNYMTVKALERYSRYDLAREIALRTIRHQLAVYRDCEPHSIWECYAPNRKAPGTNTDAKTLVAKDFCGWSALGPSALFIENVIGIREADAFANTVRWELPKDVKGTVGVKRYRFGKTTCDLLYDGKAVRVVSDAAFTLYVNGRAFGVKKGENIFEGPYVPFGFVTVGPESARTNVFAAVEKVRLDVRRAFELRQAGAVVTVLPGVSDVVFDAVRHLDHGGNIRVVDARADDPVRARDAMIAEMMSVYGPGANPCLQPRWKAYGNVVNIRRGAEKAKGTMVVDAVMVGDSITQGWHHGKPAMDRLFKDWKVVSLGCSGDQVQDQLGSCLWGGLDGYKAKIVQVMIGTNNAGSNDPEDVAAGIAKLVGVIREKQPDARVLLMPIFPSRNKPVPGAPNAHREHTDRVNALIRPLADGDKVVWFELYDEWLDEKGDCKKELFFDGLHPNAAGYELWATKMKPYWEKARADWKGDATKPSAIPLPDPKTRESYFTFHPVTSNTWQLTVDPKVGDLTPAAMAQVDLWIHRHAGSHVLVHPCGDVRVDSFLALQTWGSYVMWCPFPYGDKRAEPYLAALRTIEGRNAHEVPCFRGPTSFYSNEWWDRGLKHLKMIESGEVKDCDIVFWGDSITHGWERKGKDVQAKYFGDRKVFNIGVSGDIVAGCLWNAENGLLDGYKTKCVMLMIGTNNGGVPEIVPGIKRLLDLVRAKQPQAVTFLLPILPCRKDYRKGEAAAEKRGTNAMLEKLCDGDKVRFVDFNEAFRNPDGTIKAELFYDYLHPNEAGYEVWAKAMKPHFDAVLDKEAK